MGGAHIELIKCIACIQTNGNHAIYLQLSLSSDYKIKITDNTRSGCWAPGAPIKITGNTRWFNFNLNSRGARLTLFSFPYFDLLQSKKQERKKIQTITSRIKVGFASGSLLCNFSSVIWKAMRGIMWFIFTSACLQIINKKSQTIQADSTSTLIHKVLVWPFFRSRVLLLSRAKSGNEKESNGHVAN